jgi:XTP/dITP diphosphohydrolase
VSASSFSSGLTPLLIATTNRGKLREILPILAGIRYACVTLSDVGNVEAPDETGQTFDANARAKARYYASATGLLTVAEDSGLEVDAMGGAPGVQSARFGGVDSSYAQKFALIEEALAGVDASRRTGRFVCALALASPSASAEQPILFEARGTIEGIIVPEARGAEGFGYDPIFFYPPFGCTLAEAGERKSTASHRAQAFRKLKGFLETEF